MGLKPRLVWPLTLSSFPDVTLIPDLFNDDHHLSNRILLRDAMLPMPATQNLSKSSVEEEEGKMHLRSSSSSSVIAWRLCSEEAAIQTHI